MIFVVNVWKDERLAQRLLSQLSVIYPGVDVIVIPDEPRLKTRLSGEWTQRYLLRALEHELSDVIVKLDPDTCVWRQAPIPDADWFGTISNDGRFARGGACGFRRATAQRIVDSGLLLNDYRHLYDRYGKFRWPHEEPDTGLISAQDRIVAEVAETLDIKPTPWKYVFILGNDNRVPDVAGWAITHPHPT